MKVSVFFSALSPKSWRLVLLGLMLLVGPIVGFVALAEDVLSRETYDFDVAVLLTVNTLSSPAMNAAMPYVTDLGGFIGVTLIAAAVGYALWRLRRRRDAVVLILSVVGAALINALLKVLFQRDRPELWERIVFESSYSFPSGHAMASSAVALSLIFIMWKTRWRWRAVAAAVSYMLLIGFTRLYLGVHYPTDIVGGWLVSAAWVSLLWVITVHHRRVSGWWATVRK